MKHLWNHSLRVYHMNGSLCGCAHGCKSNKVKIFEDWGLFKTSQYTANTNSTRLSLNPQRLNIFYACKLQVGYPLDATNKVHTHHTLPNETTAWSLTQVIGKSWKSQSISSTSSTPPSWYCKSWSLHQTPMVVAVVLCQGSAFHVEFVDLSQFLPVMIPGRIGCCLFFCGGGGR